MEQPTFYEFMMRYLEKDSCKGDLARDMKRDASTGGGVEALRTREELRQYIDRKSGGWDAVLKTFAESWRAYVKHCQSQADCLTVR